MSRRSRAENLKGNLTNRTGHQLSVYRPFATSGNLTRFDARPSAVRLQDVSFTEKRDAVTSIQTRTLPVRGKPFLEPATPRAREGDRLIQPAP